ncbi:Hint domain-containing protein [uncultured Sphingomonas sp.]|uniref:Hint domain-containing protein n=1 Tax=uncultured Sphingomonas sp. TaxID=158754 RepID=UPI0025E9F18F|nr:Hint domain-containing protein [uncultured Sphingomonas sp.]
MAKALKTAAFVVGAVALAATGIGAAASAGLIAASSFTAAAATVGTIASVAAAGLSIAASAVAPKGTVGGNATQFKIDKDAGLPVAIGRTYSGGNVVHRQYYGPKNSLESWVTVHSIGPVRSLGPLLINKVAVALVGTAITGSYAGWMWLDQQLGACPEARALAGPQGPFPGWTGNSKLSGLAADLWTLKFDDKGKIYPNGVPQRGRIVEGVYVYDPRLDSSYPGGSGACRLGQEATYVWSENPALHAATWAYGRIQNGVLVAGGGMEIEGIDLAPFVEWANVCDVNAWKAGGIVYTTTDNSWDILKMIAQAGGGEVFPVGAQLSCSFNAPRVSIGTITSNDICGDVDVPGTPSRRARRNTVIARVRLESHGWEEVPLDAIAIPAYVAADGGSRPTEISFPLVQQVDQGAQLGLYAMWNGRELDGIVLPCKVYAIGYRPGDCLTLNVPEAALARDVVVRQREIDGASMGVTLTCRSETAAKHPFCLGKTGNPPPTPDLSVPPSYAIDNPSLLQLAVAGSFPIGLTISAAADGTVTISDHTRRYNDGHPDVAVTGATIASGAAAGELRAIGYDDDGRTGGAVTYQLVTDDLDARASPTHPGRHYVGYVFIPSAGSPPSSGGGATPPGGNCPTNDTPILMADRSEKPAGDIVVGDEVWTRHERTLRWGTYPVEAVTIVDSDDVWEATIGGKLLRATGGHLVYTGEWVEMRTIGTKLAGTHQVVKITVTDAHTYVSNGILSHNIKRDDPTEAQA